MAKNTTKAVITKARISIIRGIAYLIPVILGGAGIGPFRISRICVDYGDVSTFQMLLACSGGY